MKNFFWIPTVLLLSGITTITILKSNLVNSQEVFKKDFQRNG